MWNGKRKRERTGIAIALAWPQTWCKRVGEWYDYPLHAMNVSTHGYYKVGHAAIVLIDDETRNCRYFDFGRYHAPHGHGRVRSAETDHDLRLHSIAEIHAQTRHMTNLHQLLEELYGNKSTHGEGPVHAAQTRIHFDRALGCAKKYQDREFIPYGLFLRSSSNCSRFVSSVLQAGKPHPVARLALQFPLMVTPTPRWNLLAAGQVATFPSQQFEDEKVVTTKPQSA